MFGGVLSQLEIRRMKHLFSGTAVAAVPAIATPIWAQSPTTSYSPGSPTTSESAPYARPAPATPQAVPRTPQAAPYAQQSPAQAPAAPAVGRAEATTEQSAEPMPRRQSMRAHDRRQHAAHMPRGAAGRKGSEPSDNVADQLNRQEAERLSSGSSVAPAENPAQNPVQQGYPPPGSQTR
jgi:hypothetical protein